MGGGAAIGERLRDVSQTPRPHLAHPHRRVPAARTRSPARHPSLAEKARESHAITETPTAMFRGPVEQLLGLLCSELAYAQVDEIIAGGLHEYLDALQTKMNQVGTHIYDTFFSGRGAVPKRQSQRRGDVVRTR